MLLVSNKGYSSLLLASLNTHHKQLEMAFKLVVFSCLVAVACGSVAVAPAPQVYAARLEEFDPLPQYRYGYSVADALTGDYKSQDEQRDGDVVTGRYSLIDSDNTQRTVIYTADPINGFQAQVTKEPLVAEPVVAAAPVAPARYVAQAAPVYNYAPAPVAAVAPARYAVAPAAVGPARYAVAPTDVVSARYAVAPAAVAPARYAVAPAAAPVAAVAPAAPVVAARYAAAPSFYSSPYAAAYTSPYTAAYTAPFSSAAVTQYSSTGPVAAYTQYAAPAEYYASTYAAPARLVNAAPARLVNAAPAGYRYP